MEMLNKLTKENKSLIIRTSLEPATGPLRLDANYLEEAVAAAEARSEII